MLRAVKSRIGTNGEAPHDAFLYLCEKLSDNGFARLRKFDPRGRAKFSTWLTVLTYRLTIDWLRARKGRERPFANVAALAPLERALFRYRYERHLSLRECLVALSPEFPGVTELRVRGALSNLEAVLAAEQRWQLSIRGAPDVPLEAAAEASDGRSAEDEATDEEEQRRLAAAFELLDAQDRLLLAYRYEQDLTYAQIARLARLGDPFRARRAVDAALARLTQHMNGDLPRPVPNK